MPLPGKPPAVFLRNGPGHGESQPDALGLAGHKRLIERIGQVGRRSGSIIFDGQLERAVAGSHRERHPAGASGGVDRIDDEVDDRRPQRLSSPREAGCFGRQIAVEPYAGMLSARAGELADLPDQPRQVDRAGRRGVGAAQRQQLLDLLLENLELPAGDDEAVIARRLAGRAAAAVVRVAGIWER